MKSDKSLGMSANITRRDFLHDAGVAAIAALVAPGATAAVATGDLAPGLTSAAYYPPTRTGMRGSHPGSFEIAHALLNDRGELPTPHDIDETYDLVVVGAGASGLAAAHFYRKRYGADKKVLLLENHDDFGGHSKRNEFHQGGKMRVSLGGTHNLEWWDFDDVVNAFMDEMGVDIEAMIANREFIYGRDAPRGPSMWFDEESYGVNRLVTNCDLSGGNALADATIDRLPVSAAGRDSLKAFFAQRTDVLEGMNEQERESYLSSISYPEFLRRHGKLEEDVIQLYDKLNHGYWGLEMRALSAREVIKQGFPGEHLLGGELTGNSWDYDIAMFPDGNASLVRLLVSRLIPEVAPGTTADNVAIASFDYSRLDVSGSATRLRLNSTVINAQNTSDGVSVSYVKDGEVLRVRGKHCVMACYHSIIPHLCPTLPEPQKEALRYQVKIPLHLTNVLLRNTDALDKLGIDGVDCPGRLHGSLFTFRGINTGGYEHHMDEKGPVSLVFWGSISPPPEAIDIHDQLRASRAIMLGLSLEDYEREVRTVLDGLLGPAGFDVERDILAITVNRWPHGYAWEYLDLWDEDWPEGEAPHEKARRTFGNIAIANADAGASAYTHTAISQGSRAVDELPA